MQARKQIQGNQIQLADWHQCTEEHNDFDFDFELEIVYANHV